MPSTYYLGTSPDEALGDSPRYWYALRRNDDGEVFLLRSDQLKDKDSVELNTPGEPSENFEDFEPGIDYFEGITDDHEVAYANLVWIQYRWDNRNMLYYIGQDEGRLIQRINQGYVYPEGTSS
jgi:hypothetical protein